MSCSVPGASSRRSLRVSFVLGGALTGVYFGLGPHKLALFSGGAAGIGGTALIDVAASSIRDQLRHARVFTETQDRPNGNVRYERLR
jgi:hypothetical protein